MNVKLLLATGIMLTAIIGNVSLSAEFPQRPVTLVIGYSAGGSNDQVGRDIGQQLSEIWNQPVVIENRPGAAGAIAAAHVAKAKPDGHTLMVGPVTLTMIPAVQAKLPFDLFKDFQPVALIGKTPLALTVNASMKADTVNDFIKIAKKDKLFSGTTGPGAVDYFATYILMDKSNIKLDTVHYKGGSESLMDLIADRVNLSFGSVTLIAQHARNGRLKVLAVSGDQRSNLFPDVPTFSEAGVDGMDVQQWWGIFAPAGTPDEIVDVINKAVNNASRTDKIKESFLNRGVISSQMTVNEFQQFVKHEYDTWQTVAKNAGIGVE